MTIPGRRASRADGAACTFMSSQHAVKLYRISQIEITKSSMTNKLSYSTTLIFFKPNKVFRSLSCTEIAGRLHVVIP